FTAASDADRAALSLILTHPTTPLAVATGRWLAALTAAGTLVLALLFVTGAASFGPAGLLVRAGAAACGAAAAAAGCALVAGAAGAAARAADGSPELAAGGVVAPVGPPGSGKTPLLAITAGRLAPDAGSVMVAGVATGTLAARALRGYAPAAPVFPPTLRVR